MRSVAQGGELDPGAFMRYPQSGDRGRAVTCQGCQPAIRDNTKDVTSRVLKTTTYSTSTNVVDKRTSHEITPMQQKLLQFHKNN